MVPWDFDILPFPEVEESSFQIPPTFFAMPEHEVWERCFVLVADYVHFEPLIEATPQLHVVGQTSDMQYFEIAACQRWVRSPNIGLVLLPAQESGLQYDVSMPTVDDIEIHGHSRAPSVARGRFIQNVINACELGTFSQGLDAYYQHYTTDYTSLMVINCLSSILRHPALFAAVELLALRMELVILQFVKKHIHGNTASRS
ncbi:uncharacterized protein PG998_002930 [Apiospora kogelbergensis]|uniref:uncharacterized protein n=1 Tax=Apiospora kogelbergensis TaxID=1337665 RepID=UPI00313087F4